jgi:hypothetical protein
MSKKKKPRRDVPDLSGGPLRQATKEELRVQQLAVARKRAGLPPLLPPRPAKAKPKRRASLAVERPDPTGLQAADVPTSGRPTVKRARFFSGGLPGHGKRHG